MLNPELLLVPVVAYLSIRLLAGRLRLLSCRAQLGFWLAQVAVVVAALGWPSLWLAVALAVAAVTLPFVPAWRPASS